MDKFYSYHLNSQQIAQRPLYPYDQARLLVADRANSQLSDSRFANLVEFLKAGDLLVFNDSRVIPARLYAHLQPGGGKVELLLLQETQPDTWIVMGKPLKKLRVNSNIVISDQLNARVIEIVGEKQVLLQFISQDLSQAIRQQLFSLGSMPIPPYIRHGCADQDDLQDYQSLFAAFDGSVAAPTASLHFTAELLAKLTAAKINVSCVTLHVGSASFLPIFTEESQQISPPGQERFEVTDSFVAAINTTRANQGRVIAVGTTVVRALESWALDKTAATDLFIEPGFKFQVCDGIITNFHQPGTTHLALVEAFIGRNLLHKSYQYALNNNFRFLSYGDGMLLI